MKVVLFCGGQGMRLRDHNNIPKPLVDVGPRPILWHLMKYYAHFGHTEFVLCLGHGAQQIKRWFLDYDERMGNDFVLSNGGRDSRLLSSDMSNWTITFADTGQNSTIGERLRRVRAHLGDDEVFLANYADGLSNLDLNAYIADFLARDLTATFLSVPAPHTFHVVHADAEHYVKSLELVSKSPMRINAGFFVLRREIFEVMNPGDELVIEPFERLIQTRRLRAVPWDGFWRNMDTFKDKVALDEMVSAGKAPWMLWAR